MSSLITDRHQPSFAICLLVVTVLALMMPDAAFCDPLPNEVRRDKGVGDRVVMVGFLFHIKIPDDAFSGEVKEYQVGADCGTPLPPWLSFDPSTQTFTGFTKAASVGSKTPVCVKAIGKKPSPDSPPSTAEDLFQIEVNVGLTQTFACPEGDSVVLATVYVDMTLPELGMAEILKIMKSVGDALEIPPENIRFTRMKGRYNPQRNPVLFEGKGDSKGQEHQGARVQFMVGCSSDTITKDSPYVQFLQTKAPNGELSRIIGYPVMDWTVHKGFPRGNRPRD